MTVEEIKVNQQLRGKDLELLQTQIEEIHHEVHFNKSTSLKDAVIRNENALSGLIVLVKRIARHISISDQLDLRMKFHLDAELNAYDINKVFLETFNMQESDVEDKNG